MNRAFLKQLLVILIILLICSGCKQNSLIGDNFLTEQNDNAAVKYKSGTILLKSNRQYNTANQNSFDNSIGDIKFEPKSIKFGN